MKLSTDRQQQLSLIGINRDEFPYDIESATKTGSDGEKKSSEDTAAPDSPNGIYDSTYKGKTDSIYFYQQLKELQAEYEAYKETLDLRWSNPNRDQELEKGKMLSLWKHNKNKLK